MDLQDQVNKLTEIVNQLIPKVKKFEEYIDYIDQLEARIDELEGEMSHVQSVID